MEVPASKRIKLEGCLICNNNSHFTKNREAYTELLINHLLPPSQRDKANNSKAFDFCITCSDVLENLFQLKEGLEFILNSIKTTVESIKFSILKNGKSGNHLIDNFRRIAVNDYCPKVRMDKNNSMMTKEKKTAERNLNKDTDLESSPISYSYDEYDEPMSVESNCDGAGNINFDEGNSLLKSISHSKPSSIHNGDSSSSNSSTGPDLPVSKTLLPTEHNKPTSTNVEDSIITVYEPPQFSFSQWQVYYENYKDMYKCKFCSTIMKGENLKASLARHINIIHAKNCRFKCGICYAIFFAKNKCRSHIGECHYEMFNMNPPKIDKEKEKVPEPVPKSIGVIPTSSHLRAATLTAELSKNSKGFAKKKTGFQNLKKSITSPAPRVGGAKASTSGKYSDDKIRSEVIINIEPKSKYNLIEDIVKFEPWDENSQELPSTSDYDPLTKSPEMIPTEEEKEELKEKKEEKEWSRPMLSYAQLAILAIKNIETKKMTATLSEICNFICINYPYFKTDADFRRKIQQAMTSASRKYFKCFAQAVKYHSLSSSLNQSVPKEKMTRVYTINDDALTGQHEIFHASFRESIYAMAYPERVNLMIGNLWRKKIIPEPAEPEQECVLKDSIDIVEGIGVKLETDAECPEVDSPLEKSGEDNPEGGELLVQKAYRPSISYCQLAYLALSNIKTDPVKTEAVNDFIKETFPFFKYCPNHGQWRAQMSKALSTNICFLRWGPGPYCWKIDKANDSMVRAEFKDVLIKQILNFHLSLADPDKLEELLFNTLGDDIDMDYLKTCIKDYSSKEKEDPNQNQSNLTDVSPQEGDEGQDNVMDVVYPPESESVLEEQNEEDDDDVVEIDPPESRSICQASVPEREREDEDSDSDLEGNIQIGNVVGQYIPPPRVVPVSVVPMIPRPVTVVPASRPVSVVSGSRPISVMSGSRPISVVSGSRPVSVVSGSRPVTVVSVPRVADKQSVIEIVQEGSGYFYRLDNDSSFTFVTVDNDNNE